LIGKTIRPAAGSINSKSSPIIPEEFLNLFSRKKSIPYQIQLTSSKGVKYATDPE